MRARGPLLLIVLALGAVCFLFWDDVLAPIFDSEAAGEANSLLGPDDLAAVDGDASDEAGGPTLAASGRARQPGERLGPDGRPLGDGIEGPGGSAANAASVPFKGKVVDKDGRPAAGVTIVMKGDGVLEKIKTGADGRFEHAARPGRYAMLFDGGDSGGLVLRSWMLDGAPKDDLEFELKEPATVEVKVLRGTEGVAEVAVFLSSRELGEMTQQELTTDPSGVATLEGLAPGRYELTAQVPEGPKVHHQFYAAPAKKSNVNVRVPDGVTLKGIVRAGKDGPGVPGARISLKMAVPRSAGLMETVVETKPDGTYEVVVPRGTPRTFEVEAEGHATWPTPKALRGVLRGLRGLRGSKPVTRNVTLLSGAVLDGLVQTEEKAPLPGIKLRFAMRRGPTVEVTTGADGRYMAANMIPGRYDLQVVSPAWFPITGQQLRVNIPGGTEPKPTTLDIALAGSRRLHGVVLDAAGQGVGGARVWILGGGRVVRSARDAGRILEVFTDARGQWTIVDIPPDKNVVVRAAMGALEADPVYAPWEKPPPMPLRMELKGTGDIAGRVIDLDTRLPVAGARVQIRPDPYDGRNGRTVYTNSEGEFRVESMLPGAYKFIPFKKNYLTAEADTANVTRGGEVNVGLNLDPGMVFAGVVVDQTGAPLRGARVNVRGRPDGKEKDVSRSINVDGRGRFSLIGFERGVYRVTAWRRGHTTQRLDGRTRSERELRVVLPKR